MLTKIITGFLLAASLYGCATPKSGYNALEIASTSEERIRIRSLVNVDLKFGNSNVGMHTLNEVDNADQETYYGRNVITVGRSVQGISVLKTDDSGITDNKYGIRFSDLSPLGGYGFVDLSADKNSANMSVFYGRSCGKFSGEMYESVEFSFNGEAKPYTEVQLYREIGNGFSIFGRAENSGFNRKETRYLFGLVKGF
jgi:hypothetical protein